MFFNSSEIFYFLPVIFTFVFQIIKFEAPVSDGGEFYPFALFLDFGIIHSNNWLTDDSNIFKAQRIHNSPKILNV